MLPSLGREFTMTNGGSRHAEFRSEVLTRCQFLEERGFRRAKELEEQESVGSGVAYMGRAVGRKP